MGQGGPRKGGERVNGVHGRYLWWACRERGREGRRSAPTLAVALASEGGRRAGGGLLEVSRSHLRRSFPLRHPSRRRHSPSFYRPERGAGKIAAVVTDWRLQPRRRQQRWRQHGGAGERANRAVGHRHCGSCRSYGSSRGSSVGILRARCEWVTGSTTCSCRLT